MTSRTSYNAGRTVLARPVFGSKEFQSQKVQLLATLRYAGDPQPVVAARPVGEPAGHPSSSAAGYAPLWKIPANARTGRYEIGLTVRDAATHRLLLSLPDAGSFVVHRLLVKIERIELGRSFYTSGDPVDCRVTIKNLTPRPLLGLRVEFSNRYWPWIAGPAARAAASVAPLATTLKLAAREEREIRAVHVAVAPEVPRPEFHQYGVVVWDHARQTPLDIAFSPLVIVRPPGVDSPEPYPPQYVYPELKDVNFKSYRRFYPAGLNRSAIQFDTAHTMFPPSAEAAVRFGLTNPTPQRWRNLRVTASLVDPSGRHLHRRVVARDATIEPGAPPLEERIDFKLPGTAGLEHVRITLRDAGGNLLAANEMGLAVNPLPESILIFCAHEDDEGGWMGLIRAAVENHIPLHLVYLTSGDAGSCDMYYQHSCGPSTALNFGGLRMAETRAALGHLGVPAGDIEFLGLPDGGSGEIWYHHVSASNPYLAVLLGVAHAPYAGLVEPNLPYARNAVLRVVRQIILKYRPAVIVTAHPPSQRHIDHIVCGYLTIKALQELEGEGKLSPSDVKVWVDRVYNPKTAPFTPYHYTDHVLYVSGEVMTLAQEAGWYYESQGSNHALGRIRSYRELPRKVSYRQVMDWMDHAGWNEKPPGAGGRQNGFQ